MELALPALIALAGAVTGALWGTRVGTIAGATLSAAATEVWLVGAHDPGVRLAPLVGGLVVGPLLLGALPFVLYTQLGRSLAHKLVSLGVVWLVLLVPLYIGWFIVSLGVLKAVACPPDSYECPV